MKKNITSASFYTKLALFFLAFCHCTPVMAAGPSYELTFTTRSFNIYYHDDMMWQKEACWTALSLYRASLRRPIFQVKNTSPEGSNRNIVNLKIRLKNQPDYTFDAAIDTYVEGVPGYFDAINSTIISPDRAENNVTSDTIELSFASNPILPGERFGFGAILKRKDGVFENFDFQNILFNITGNNRSDNTTIQVTYSDGTILPEVSLFEYQRASQLYSGGYDGTSGESIAWFCGSSTTAFEGYNGKTFMAKAGVDGYLGTYIFKQEQVFPTPTPTRTATRTATPSPTRTSTYTPSNTPTNTPTATRTYPPLQSTATPTPAMTSTPIKPQSLLAVEPIAECIREIDSTKSVAVFSYINNNPNAVVIPAGTTADNMNVVLNALAPIEGQTTTFLPGFNRATFEVMFSKNSSVTWMLKFAGFASTPATADSTTPICASDFKPVCKVNTTAGPYSGTCEIPLTTISLNGSMSYDPEGKPLDTTWSTDCPGQITDTKKAVTSIVFSDPAFGKAVNCSITLTVNDSVYSENCSTTITITPCNKQCGETDIKNSQFIIDSSAFKIAATAKKIAKLLAKNGSKSEKKNAERIKKRADELYRKIWTQTWSITSKILTCTNTVLCTQSDNTAVINTLTQASIELQKLVKQSSAKLSKLTGNKKAAAKYNSSTQKLANDATNEIKRIPNSQSICQ